MGTVVEKKYAGLCQVLYMVVLAFHVMPATSLDTIVPAASCVVMAMPELHILLQLPFVVM